MLGDEGAANGEADEAQGTYQANFEGVLAHQVEVGNPVLKSGWSRQINLVGNNFVTSSVVDLACHFDIALLDDVSILLDTSQLGVHLVERYSIEERAAQSEQNEAS